MPRILAGILVSMLLFVAVAMADDTELKEFISQECHFRILMPGTPQATSRGVPTSSGTFILYSFVVAPENDATYMVGSTDYGAANLNPPQAVLEGARDGAVANVAGTLLTDTVISLNGVPGRAFTARNQDGFYFDAHVYYVNHHLYQVLIVTSKNNSAKYRDAFMNSFTIR